MNLRSLVLTAPWVLGCAIFARPAIGEDLLQIYREAQSNDPAIASARASWVATQEKLPQARAGLLPSVTVSATANATNFGTTIKTDPKVDINRNFANIFGTISASQPLYRAQNVVVVSQATQQVTQADFSLGVAQQDLILRVAVAYFDVLLAQYTIELTESQKAAMVANLMTVLCSEQSAQPVVNTSVQASS